MEKFITVVSVSWYSSEHLKRLIENLLSKAENPEKVRFLIIDNTAGADVELADALTGVPSMEIKLHDPQSSQRSISHASALDKALPLIQSHYLLVIDPDVHIFRVGWDRFCIGEVESGKVAVGAPYPPWKLGKIHDSPSVVFFFGKTEWFRSVSGGWYPFPSFLLWGWNFVVRKFVRLFGFATRRRLESSELMRGITSWLEKLTGVTSPDTGWRYSKAAIELGNERTIFEAEYVNNERSTHAGLLRLAEDFELFFFHGKPFLTHLYSSGISYYRTNHSDNPNVWLSAIQETEGELQ
ncbi:MAG: hypothetical protein CMG71_08455 [Candidatus Marinimicrobia bacterium]|nr:hypothetical protein [Candidatus Neomarinimicrobiota bacterium]|tara:strand:+ start:18225 stop:19112 length:888 start_codon:yes stop_codon:yes gene_type:complete